MSDGTLEQAYETAQNAMMTAYSVHCSTRTRESMAGLEAAREEAQNAWCRMVGNGGFPAREPCPDAAAAMLLAERLMVLRDVYEGARMDLDTAVAGAPFAVDTDERRAELDALRSAKNAAGLAYYSAIAAAKAAS